jgi:hypothetical protein
MIHGSPFSLLGRILDSLQTHFWEKPRDMLVDSPLIDDKRSSRIARQRRELQNLFQLFFEILDLLLLLFKLVSKIQ